MTENEEKLNEIIVKLLQLIEMGNAENQARRTQLAMRVEDPAPEKLADAARLALDALSTPRRAKVTDAHAALTEALRNEP